MTTPFHRDGEIAYGCNHRGVVVIGMKRQGSHKKWTTCPTCHQLVFATYGLGEHACPDEARARKEAELDMFVDDEFATWDYDQKVFWKSKDVRFVQHLLDTGQYD